MRLNFLKSILLNVDAKLSDLRRTLAQAIEGMSADDFARHPPDKWSSAEILDHLNLSYLGTIKNFERCLASGKPGATSDRHSKRWARRVITGLGFFPSGRKSPERILPRGTPIEKLRTEVFENIARMDAVISECDLRFGKGQPIAEHPALGPLTAHEWRKFHLVHGKHHVRQIEKLKKLL